MGRGQLAQPVAQFGGQAYVELVGDDRFEAVGGGGREQGGLVETGERGAPGGRGDRVVLLLDPGQVVAVTAGLGERVGVAPDAYSANSSSRNSHADQPSQRIR